MSDRAALRAELDLPTDGPLIGCFGRVRHQKGNDLFVTAMIDVFARHKDAKALIMGRARTEHQGFLTELKTRVADAGLKDRILFRDEVPIELLSRHFQALDLYVAPQRWEGFGLTPLEAMACGAPVVATRVGAFEELIVDGETGYLVEIEDSDAMAEHVSHLLDAPEHRAQMSVAARDRAAGTFRIEQEAAAIVEVYRRLLSS